MRTQPMKRVLLLERQDMAGDWFRRVLRGVATYVSSGIMWEVRPAVVISEDLTQIRNLEADGIITVIRRDDPIEAWTKIGCPVVSVISMRENPPVPFVSIDEEAVGIAAAGHLVERRFRHFGFLGFSKSPASETRRLVFKANLGHPESYSELNLDQTLGRLPLGRSEMADSKILKWLDALPKPVGIMAWNDLSGIALVQAARRLGCSVPGDIAIIGVDDDETWCGMSLPQLSSVRTPSRRIGFQAAAILDRLMGGEKIPPGEMAVKLPPEGVHARRSTDTLATNDPLITQSVELIHQHLANRVNVNDLVRMLSISRRQLETRFHEVLGRTPLQEIHNIQITAAERLLRTTELPLKTVAVRTGFRDANHLIRAFSSRRGVAPATYRKRSKLW